MEAGSSTVFITPTPLPRRAAGSTPRVFSSSLVIIRGAAAVALVAVEGVSSFVLRASNSAWRPAVAFAASAFLSFSSRKSSASLSKRSLSLWSIAVLRLVVSVSLVGGAFCPNFDSFFSVSTVLVLPLASPVLAFIRL